MTFRLVTDHLGSVRFVVDTSASAVDPIVQRTEYDEFGRLVQRTCPGLTPAQCKGLHPFGFAGGLYDGNTGLVRFGVRDYDPTTGRWTARDPILFDGLSSNLFAYAGLDPINNSDPFGLRAYGCGKTGRIMEHVRRNAARGIPHAAWAHLPGHRFDFKAHHRWDTFQVGKWRLLADEFGNFLAGYAGIHAAGELGYWGARAGGWADDLFDGGGLTGDRDSIPDIDSGADWARRGGRP